MFFVAERLVLEGRANQSRVPSDRHHLCNSNNSIWNGVSSVSGLLIHSPREPDSATTLPKPAATGALDGCPVPDCVSRHRYRITELTRRARLKGQRGPLPCPVVVSSMSRLGSSSDPSPSSVPALRYRPEHDADRYSPTASPPLPLRRGACWRRTRAVSEGGQTLPARWVGGGSTE